MFDVRDDLEQPAARSISSIGVHLSPLGCSSNLVIGYDLNRALQERPNISKDEQTHAVTKRSAPVGYAHQRLIDSFDEVVREKERFEARPWLASHRITAAVTDQILCTTSRSSSVAVDALTSSFVTDCEHIKVSSCGRRRERPSTICGGIFFNSKQTTC